MNKYLDDNGLLYLWGKIKSIIPDVSGKANSADLGTAAAKNVPSSGDASSSEVVLGNDSRLSDSRTPTSHSHGNIQNEGILQTTDITVASGDKLIVTDSSDSNKIARTSISFDGSTTTKALTPKGTFETFLQTHQSKADIGLGNVTNDAQVKASEKGVANGVATLDSNGLIPSSQLPSYVDDVIEVYGIANTTALTSGWLSTTSNGSALTPESGKIYVLMTDFPSTNPTHYANSQYRWSGTTYVQIYDSGVTSITNNEIDTIVAS